MAGQADLSDDGGMSDSTSPTPEIAARMKKARVDAGLTQEKAAELIGVSRTAVTMWENKRKPALPETFRLQRIEHDFFSENEYKIGDNSIAVRTFIGQHQAALKHAGIVAVGARDPSQETWTGYAVE